MSVSGRRHPDVSAYGHLGSWIDIYNRWPWRHPTLAIRKLHHRHVRTLFLQTSNYGADLDVYRRGAVRRFLEAAHRRDMQVVAWSVPGLRRTHKDFRRARAAVAYRSRDGERFDSFAMDIEATLVHNIWLRNRALVALASRLRHFTGPTYPLGAITPDPVRSTYWPRFPYERAERIFDVFVPMGYFSFRAHGYEGAKRYTARGIRKLRREIGPDVPIHVIGGIGGDTRAPEAKGFVRAVKGHNVLGGSYYDFSATTDREWKELTVLARAKRSRGRVGRSDS